MHFYMSGRCASCVGFSARADAMLEEMLALKGIPSSQIPGRPKKWKSKCMEILETSIANK